MAIDTIGKQHHLGIIVLSFFNRDPSSSFNLS